MLQLFLRNPILLAEYLIFKDFNAIVEISPDYVMGGNKVNPFYEQYMAVMPPVKYRDHLIEDFSVNALAPFLDQDGALSENLDVVMKGSKIFSGNFIFSTFAKYETIGDAPAVQIRLIDKNGHTLYYSPVYEIGHRREYYRREWRVPGAFDRYDTVRVSFIIPDGARLFLRDLRIKHDYGFRERNIGIRYHGHGGCTIALGFQITAELGYTSCITIPKFTKDGVAICLHDDDTVINELRLDDGSVPEKDGKYDKSAGELTYEEICELNAKNRHSDVFTGMRAPTMEEYFRICSSTGMQPIFSVHPILTKEQWLYVRDLLIKYRLLEHFRVKSNRIETHKTCLEVFGQEIAGYILLYGPKDYDDPQTLYEKIGFDRSRHEVVVEYFEHLVTEEKIKIARQQGFYVSIAAMKGGISGFRMQELIDLGVSEFTLDHHCSMGLSW